MACVFLSYDHDDGHKARLIAQTLERAGHFVWRDLHIKGGEQYSDAIKEALDQADAVIVLWSLQSLDSAWVRDEAAVGRDRGRLVPVLIEAVEPPLGFRQYQNIDISTWKGRGQVPHLEELLASLERLTDNDQLAESPAVVTVPPAPRRWPLARIGALLAAAIVLATAAVLLLRDRQAGTVQTVAVAAANPAAEPLARDLVVNLAALQSARSGAMRLIGRDEAQSRADLIFEISGDTRSPKPAANLVLMTGKDRTILWSGDFEQKAGGAADLKQQAGYTAARVLGCALEALSSKNEGLRQSLVKLYLNACAQLAETLWHDPGQVIAILESVTKEAPRFEPAWAKLLVAETNRYQEMSAAEQKASAGRLRQAIASARQVNPEIPEAYVAEIELLPGGAFYDQVRLIDRAVKSGPDNGFALANRSLVMLGVGRLEESVEDARKATRLDPLSPGIRSYYIQALTYSGDIETARSELVQAERLWPSATTILNARSRLILRYGNTIEAADALKLMQSGRIEAGRTREAFIRARLSPTQENVDRAVELAKAAYRSRPEIETAAEVIYALGEFDRTEELLNFLLVWKDANQVPYFVEMLFRPPLADLRADPRFMQVAARFGLLSYWQRSGNWPDFCSDPDLPYDCKAEAAKIAA